VSKFGERRGRAIDDGTASIKVFTTDVTGQGWRQDRHRSLLDLMRVIAEHDGVLAVHAEDDELSSTRRPSWRVKA
jgi:hypothetical protein